MTKSHDMWGWDTSFTDSSYVHFFEGNNTFYKSIHELTTLTRVKSSGGEPLLSQEWIKWIDAFIDNGSSKNMTIECHTNATKFSDENIERMLQYKEVKLVLSIDATDKCYEYIRYPMTWVALNNSIDKFTTAMPSDKIKELTIGCVVNVYSIFDVENFMEWALTKFKNSNAAALNIWYELVFPLNRDISIKWLPDDLKTDILVIINRMIDVVDSNPQLNSNIFEIREYLNKSMDITSEELITKQCQMKREIVAFDESRNQSYVDFLHPKLVDWLNTIHL